MWLVYSRGKMRQKHHHSMATKLLLTFAICRLIVTIGLTLDPTELLHLEVEGRLSLEPADVGSASRDFGGMQSAEPLTVLHPASAGDIARLVKSVYESAYGFGISAHGHGHSINGQAMTKNGLVIQMTSSGKQAPPWVSEKFTYVDVWGGELWVDVLRSTLEYGLAPKSWTDYLYLSIGGTLSNAGISGQAFNHGPQSATCMTSTLLQNRNIYAELTGCKYRKACVDMKFVIRGFILRTNFYDTKDKQLKIPETMIQLARDLKSKF